MRSRLVSSQFDRGFSNNIFVLGSVIDIQLKGFLEANEASDGESLQRLEQRVARRFEEPTTQETRELRERFREVRVCLHA